MLRYLRDIHLGRIDPRDVGFRLQVRAERHDFAAILRAAVAGRRVGDAVADLRPRLTQYGALRYALARYRRLAAGPPLPPLPTLDRAVRPGALCPGVNQLSERLARFGDLAEDPPNPGSAGRYDGPVVDAVRRFQIRHGLEPDGVIGKGTQAALSVPLEWRVRQIELSLERLRWVPDLGDGRLIVLNIPMFHLWAWDSPGSNPLPAFETDLIVGRALSTETPVFVEQMREIVFRPYWNVPPSILRHEVLPAVVKDPLYLSRQQMEIVRGQGDGAVQVDATAENLELARRGVLRVRQRPGSHNALGLVEFVFPNAENVYMHGTPAHALFDRSRRDFSHGCVRVRDPASLAEWALAGQTEWSRERIAAAMNGDGTRHVRLARPIQVILFYTTATVSPADGTLRFADDIYRHDQTLDRALREAARF